MSLLTEKKTGSKLLYHYCKLNTFLSILHSKSLRLNDIQTSNDRLELYAAYKDYFNHCGKKQLAVKHNLDYLIRLDLDKNTYYSLCFSPREDSLWHWSMYCPNGGVAIGFSRDYLETWAKGIRCQGKEATVTNIHYIPFDEGEDQIASYNEMCALSGKSPTIKSEEFKEDDEVRISIKNAKADNDCPYGYPLCKKPPLEKDGKIIPLNISSTYYDIPFDTNEIKQIILGPKNTIETEELNAILELNGLCVRAEKTKSSYK